VISVMTLVETSGVRYLFLTEVSQDKQIVITYIRTTFFTDNKGDNS
jgi:hypothetical protein